MAAITTDKQPTIGRRQIKWHTVWTVLIGLFWLAIVVGIVGGYFLHLNTGFPENGKLWDWLQLLSAPVFASALPFIFTGQQRQADDKTAARTTASDTSQVDENHKQEEILEAYQDHIVDLLLNKNLTSSQPKSDVHEAARVRTLTALRRLGTQHKGEVLRFLYEAELIYKDKTIVDLRQADLSGTDLSNIKLSGANLSGIDFSNANLSGADLSNALFDGANLKGANLRGAYYSPEQLSKAVMQ